MKPRIKRFSLLLLSLFFCSQVNAIVHFATVDHKICKEHATAIHQDHKHNDSNKKNDNSQQDDCRVIALLTHASTNVLPELIPIMSATVFVMAVALKQVLFMVDQGDRYFLAPSNSPPN